MMVFLLTALLLLVWCLRHKRRPAHKATGPLPRQHEVSGRERDACQRWRTMPAHRLALMRM